MLHMLRKDVKATCFAGVAQSFGWRGAPPIDAGKMDEATLNTLVVENYIMSFSEIRAQTMLQTADKLASNSGLTEDENAKLHNLVEAAHNEQSGAGRFRRCSAFSEGAELNGRHL